MVKPGTGGFPAGMWSHLTMSWRDAESRGPTVVDFWAVALRGDTGEGGEQAGFPGFNGQGGVGGRHGMLLVKKTGVKESFYDSARNRAPAAQITAGSANEAHNVVGDDQVLGYFGSKGGRGEWESEHKPAVEVGGRTPGTLKQSAGAGAKAENKLTTVYEGGRGGQGQKGGDKRDGQRWSYSADGSPINNFTLHEDTTNADFPIAKVMMKAVKGDDRQRNTLRHGNPGAIEAIDNTALFTGAARLAKAVVYKTLPCVLVNMALNFVGCLPGPSAPDV